MFRSYLILLFSLSAILLNAQKLTIEGEYFYLNGAKLPFWGVRVASASQNEANTYDLIKNLRIYKSYGINAISVFIQGSSGGYTDPFKKGGKKIDNDHLSRLKSIIEACRDLNMVVIVGIFYQRTMVYDNDLDINSEADVYQAVRTATKKLKSYKNIIINVANEQNSYLYKEYKAFDFNNPQNIIRLCEEVKKIDDDRIVGAGGYNDSLNVIIGKSPAVDALLFDTFSGDIEKNQHSGWHYDYFKSQGVPEKPIINVELFGGWTGQFIPQGVYTEEGKKIHLQEIDEALKRPGLYVHFHSNTWMQGVLDGYPTRYDVGGFGTMKDPGIRWWFEYLRKKIQ
ncbi:MAG: cellulase family glycosylhydrolase [Bacteroidota bacterium]